MTVYRFAGAMLLVAALHGAALAAPEQRVGEVHRDPRQPRIQRLSDPETSDRLVGADERLLSKVVRITRIAGETVRHPVDRALITPHDLAEGRLISGLSREHQIGVVPALQ